MQGRRCCFKNTLRLASFNCFLLLRNLPSEMGRIEEVIVHEQSEFVPTVKS